MDAVPYPLAARPRRRERNMQDKHARIFRAAAHLFAERGFGAVTTHEVSERADVAAGTLFRYAASKDALLLMVYNQELRNALARGAERAGQLPDLVDSLLAMVAPILELGRLHAENLAVYQRQLMFGSPAEKYRLEGLALIAGLEAAIAERLSAHAAQGKGRAPSDAARLASISIFAATHLAVSRASTGAHPGHDPMDDLRAQIRQIVDGYFAGLAAGAPDPGRADARRRQAPRQR